MRGSIGRTTTSTRVGAVSITGVLALAFAADANAAGRYKPAAGERFTTSNTVEFVAERGPTGPDVAIVFLRSRENFDSSFTPGPQDEQRSYVRERVDMGFLGGKIGLGTRYWTVCPVLDTVTGDEIVKAACDEPASFHLRFRHRYLSARDARSGARTVLGSAHGGAYEHGSGHRLQCRRQTRIKRRCSVRWFAGDLVFSGSVTIYRKRRDDLSELRYRSRITTVNEYCIFGRGRSREACSETSRRSGVVGD